MPSNGKAGEIFRFISDERYPTSDIGLTCDHYVLMLPDGYRTGCLRDDSDYFPCLTVRKSVDFLYTNSA